MSNVRQTTIDRQAQAEAQALQQATIGVPLVNVMAPDNFIPPISIVIINPQERRVGRVFLGRTFKNATGG